jgi:membrane-bound metal-dependent hydrolase YbcI (DUF457 family)
MKKQIGGSLWFAAILTLIIGIFVVIPNFNELWSDGTFWLFVAVAGIVGTSMVVTKQQNQ